LHSEPNKTTAHEKQEQGTDINIITCTSIIQSSPEQMLNTRFSLQHVYKQKAWFSLQKRKERKNNMRKLASSGGIDERRGERQGRKPWDEARGCERTKTVEILQELSTKALQDQEHER
jgi:hypothetical protein